MGNWKFAQLGDKNRVETKSEIGNDAVISGAEKNLQGIE